MNRLKCTDCGQVFDGSHQECPNCGCPSKSCAQLADSVINESDNNQDFGLEQRVTTDTGVSAEKTIWLYGDVVFWICVVLGIVSLFISLIVAFKIGNEDGFTLFFSSLVGVGLLIIFAFVWRAFVRVLHNISVNLHEINMKTK